MALGPILDGHLGSASRQVTQVNCFQLIQCCASVGYGLPRIKTVKFKLLYSLMQTTKSDVTKCTNAANLVKIPQAVYKISCPRTLGRTQRRTHAGTHRQPENILLCFQYCSKVGRDITIIPWAVRLSWLDNAYTRSLFSAGDFDP